MAIPVNMDYLKLPMGMLEDIDDVKKFQGLSKENARAFAQEYPKPIAEKIITSLRFADRNPDYNFRALLPNLAYSNEQIHQFLKKVLVSIDQPFDQQK